MRRIRLQVAITLLAVAVLFGGVAYLALNVTTQTAPDYGGTYVEGVAGNPEYINPLLCQPNPLDRTVPSSLAGWRAPTARRDHARPRRIVGHLRGRHRVHLLPAPGRRLARRGPFTADDVVYTISTIQQPEFPGEADIANLWRTVVIER